MVKSIFGGLLMSAVVFLISSHSAHAAKINLNPSSITLTEGQSQQVNLTLDEPIICMEADPCQVSVSISTSSPTRATITTSPVIIPFNQWFQTFSFTLAAVDDELDNGDVTPTVTLTTVSGSEYYNGFSPSLSLTILDNDEPAQQSTENDQDLAAQVAATDSQSNPGLAATGQRQSNILIVAFVVTLLTSGNLIKKLIYAVE